jgi:hypothetical protein
VGVQSPAYSAFYQISSFAFMSMILFWNYPKQIFWESREVAYSTLQIVPLL